MSESMGTLVETDGRKRITLGKYAEYDRYVMTKLPDGAILLEPAVVMTERERKIMTNPEYVQTLRRRHEEADAGIVRPIDWSMFDDDATIGQRMADNVADTMKAAIAAREDVAQQA